MAIDMSSPYFEVEICAPESAPLRLKVKEIVLPGTAGVLTICKEHTPLLTTLLHGAVEFVDSEGKEGFFAVHGGFAEVVDDRVLILTSGYEHSASIDLSRAEAAQQRAEALLRKRDEGLDMARAEAALARSLARLQAGRHEHY